GRAVSRREPIDRPGAVWPERVTKSVVQSLGATLPKFHALRFETISAPVRWKRHFSIGEPLFHFLKASVKNPARVNHRALMGSPRAKLGAERTRLKIFFRFFARRFFDSSLDSNLALDFHPIHHQRGVRIFFELFTFVARIVGEENKAALIE